MEKQKIVIIGAGPGGLTAGMLLAHRGHDVQIFEKDDRPGGRNQTLEFDDYKFDTGPTFLMMKYILDRVFEETGRKPEDYCKFSRLSPMYRLVFPDQEINVYDEPNKMKQEMAKLAPEDVDGLDKFIKHEKTRLAKLTPLLEKNNNNWADVLSLNFFRAMPYFGAEKSLYDVLGGYFKNERMRLSFTFQSKYLGMSPWNCPGGYAIIPYIEHNFGIWHVEGGLNKISEAMAKVVKEEKGKINYNDPVKKIIIENMKAVGVELKSGKKEMADQVIINADFAYAMTNLIPDGVLKKYSKEALKKKEYSASGLLLYLGLDKVYNLEHHTIVFAKDYKNSVEDNFKKKLRSEDLSFYVRNDNPLDKTQAPAGKSGLYVLLPVTNNRAGINWEAKKQEVRDQLVKEMEERLNLKDLSKHIVTERILTPDDWDNQFNVYLGAIFNLAHNIKQMLWFRPHNKFEELDNCYIVGGGTHPGSGLPTIYESGRIAADLISK